MRRQVGEFAGMPVVIDDTLAEDEWFIRPSRLSYVELATWGPMSVPQETLDLMGLRGLIRDIIQFTSYPRAPERCCTIRGFSQLSENERSNDA